MVDLLNWQAFDPGSRGGYTYARRTLESCPIYRAVTTTTPQRPACVEFPRGRTRRRVAVTAAAESLLSNPRVRDRGRFPLRQGEPTAVGGTQ